jgi:hypothetical protein
MRLGFPSYNCNTRDAGFDWKSRPELYLYGTVEEIYKKDPLGARLTQFFASKYQRVFMNPRRSWRYFGRYKDVVCGIKTGRLELSIAPDNQTGGSMNISPTDEFYDTCVIPVSTRFGIMEFLPTEVTI